MSMSETSMRTSRVASTASGLLILDGLPNLPRGRLRPVELLILQIAGRDRPVQSSEVRVSRGTVTHFTMRASAYCFTPLQAAETAPLGCVTTLQLGRHGLCFWQGERVSQ